MAALGIRPARVLGVPRREYSEYPSGTRAGSKSSRRRTPSRTSRARCSSPRCSRTHGRGSLEYSRMGCSRTHGRGTLECSRMGYCEDSRGSALERSGWGIGGDSRRVRPGLTLGYTAYPNDAAHSSRAALGANFAGRVSTEGHCGARGVLNRVLTGDRGMQRSHMGLP